MFLITPIVGFLKDLGVFTWDFGLVLYNLVTPSRKVGHVTPEGHPGAGGKWPDHIPPKDGDSRSCCPGLNAMANHGIIAHDGKNISFKDVAAKIHATYNFAPSYCLFVSNFAAKMMKKNYGTDTFDLAELNLHSDKGGIEYDGSMTRQDSAFDPDQGKPYIPQIEELLASATGKDKAGNTVLTTENLAAYNAKRRIEAKASNPEFTLDFTHQIFGSTNCVILLKIFGGRVLDLKSILIDEKLPEEWESRVRSRAGLTSATLNSSVLPMEYRTRKMLSAKLASQQAEASHDVENATQP